MSGNVSLKSSLKLSGTTTSSTDIVQVNDGATFTMDGGSISGNEFLGTGGSTSKKVALLWNNGGTVNLNGGEICDNTVVGCADNVNVAPIVVSSGTLTIGKNFVLSGNTVQMAAGYSVTSSASGVLVYNDDTSVKPVLNMGGTISGNKGGQYGGVAVQANATVTVSGTITGNTAEKSGSGVFLIGGTLTMTGGEIRGNTVTDDNHR